MNIWIMMVWVCDNWEILDVLFNDNIVTQRVIELFEAKEDRIKIRVECWYKDPINENGGYFLGADVYWRDDWLEDA